MPERIQLKRTRGWRLPPNTVIVDRRSIWGNPFKVGMLGVPDAATAVEKFRRAIRDREHDKYFVFHPERLRQDLGDKNLACWCPLDQPCHADVLLEIANGGEP